MSIQYYEIRRYQLRHGIPNHTPEAKPAGLTGPFGAFTPIIGEETPFLVMLLTYSSFAEAEKAVPELDALDGYVRYDRTILRAFPGMPELKLPPASSGGHIFELRTYESNTPASLGKKIAMFDNGERQIFERLGMNPVFFGEALIGRRLPQLTYMLAYDDLAARDRVWQTFVSDPEWVKMIADPELSNAKIVSNLSSAILGPTAYSDIR